MENKNIRIRKVHVLSLIAVLNDLFQKGVDFVDIAGEQEDGQDIISLIFCKSYMDEEMADKFEELIKEQLPPRMNIKLSDDDLNELI